MAMGIVWASQRFSPRCPPGIRRCREVCLSELGAAALSSGQAGVLLFTPSQAGDGPQCQGAALGSPGLKSSK